MTARLVDGEISVLNGMNHETLKGRARLALALAAFALLAACDYLPFGYTPVKEIVSAPANFEGRTVKVRGTVRDVTRVPLLDLKTFVLSDQGAGVTVVTDANLPAAGDNVALEGTVRSAAIIGGQSLGLRVQETRRIR